MTFEAAAFAAPTNEQYDEIARFLAGRGITMEREAGLYVTLRGEDGRLAATGALDSDVIKYIAVDESAVGEGLAAKVVSELSAEAYRAGQTHLFLFTKPESERLFGSLGFTTIAKTAEAVMMENRKNGLNSFLSGLPRRDGVKAAIVMNANPFTNGHLYLCEKAARRADFLYIFVLSEDRSEFSAKVRAELVREGTAHIKNAYVAESGKYLVSHATFPAYFIKDMQRAEDVRADMDIALFGSRIAKSLGITLRFVGTEPYCPVTRHYNERMKALLPAYGVELVELERKDGISASAVRKLRAAGDIAAIKPLVPETTYEYIKNNA